MRRSTIARIQANNVQANSIQTKKPKKRKVWLYILIGLVGLAILGAFVEDDDVWIPYVDTEKQPPKTEVVPKKPEWQKEQFSAWDGSHRKVVKHIKQLMHNPKSFKHVQTTYMDTADRKHRLITMTYRGSNAFNAIVTNTTIVKVDLKGNVVSVIR